MVVYVGLDSLSDSTVGSAIGAILLADLTSVAGHIYNHEREKVRVNILVDESAEVVSANSFVSLLNKSAGAGFRVIFAAQTTSDFAAKTGSEDAARQMLGNANNLIAFRTRDAKTQEFIVETIGKTTVQTIAESQSTGAVHGDNLLAHSGGYGERLVDVETDIFAPELLGQLPDLHYIASISSGRVVKGRIPLLTMDKSPSMEEQFWLRQTP
jgi:conjugal transfer pilus assembly protein TraD